MKSLCAFAKYTTQKFITNPTAICVNGLILTPICPFDIKCKKLNAKNLWKFIFRAYRRVTFFIFFKFALDHEGGGGGGGGGGGVCFPIPFRIFVDHVTIFSLSPMQHLR